MARLLILLLLASAPAYARPRVVTVTTSIEFFGPIKFVGSSSMLDRRRSTQKMIDALVRSLEGNPSIKKIEVRAYGADAKSNQHQLGMARARAIVDALVARGVDAKRLVARGQAFPKPGETPQPAFFILEREGDAAKDTGSGLLLP